MDSLIRQLYEIPGKVFPVKNGQYLFHEGETASYFYIVRSGNICIQQYSTEGHALSLRLARQGSIIGELPLYEEHPVYIFSAIAQSDSSVYGIEFPVLHSYLETKPHLAVNLLKIIGAHMRKQHSKFRDLILYGKKGALYSTLIRLASSYGKETPDGILITVPLTNQDLANYSSTARESINRILKDLRKQNIIETNHSHILIRNIEFLKAEIHCLNCEKEICNIE